MHHAYTASATRKKPCRKTPTGTARSSQHTQGCTKQKKEIAHGPLKACTQTQHKDLRHACTNGTCMQAWGARGALATRKKSNRESLPRGGARHLKVRGEAAPDGVAEAVGFVRGGDDEDARAAQETVPQLHELRAYVAHDLVLMRARLAEQRVDLVDEEDDGLTVRRELHGEREHPGRQALAVAVVLGEDRRPTDVDQDGPDLPRKRLHVERPLVPSDSCRALGSSTQHGAADWSRGRHGAVADVMQADTSSAADERPSFSASDRAAIAASARAVMKHGHPQRTLCVSMAAVDASELTARKRRGLQRGLLHGIAKERTPRCVRSTVVHHFYWRSTENKACRDARAQHTPHTPQQILQLPVHQLPWWCSNSRHI